LSWQPQWNDDQRQWDDQPTYYSFKEKLAGNRQGKKEWRHG